MTDTAAGNRNKLLIVRNIDFLRVNRRDRNRVEAIAKVHYKENARSRNLDQCVLVDVPARDESNLAPLRQRLIDEVVFVLHLSVGQPVEGSATIRDHG